MKPNKHQTYAIFQIVLFQVLFYSCTQEPDVNQQLYATLQNNGKPWNVQSIMVGDDPYRATVCDRTVSSYGTITFLSESELEYTYTDARPPQKMTYSYTDTGIKINGVPYTEYPCFSDYDLDASAYLTYEKPSLIGQSGEAYIVYYLMQIEP